ncbi:helix-turn-helix domain-containing protein [Streptomyces sp. NPDC006700]|uniref:helix-turn-helix domain-containing protein n=1 Tax=Streptomyces sp. NPDC006700 TaxID=3154479 RepID=UPI003404BB11
MHNPLPDDALQRFGTHVRRLREERELSLELLAERSGLSFRGLIYIEHGRRNPSLLTLLKLASGLSIKASCLLEEFDDLQ